MRLPYLVFSLISLLLLWSACAPSVRQQLEMDTATYTQCDYVQVDCADDTCSALQGGPWMATACGTRYRCTRTAGQVVCAPQDRAPADIPMPPQ